METLERRLAHSASSRRKNRGFFAPAKALQGLKDKLGQLYYDARLIECPQNAVEFEKLLKILDDLETQKGKKLSGAAREQKKCLSSSRRLLEVNSPIAALLPKFLFSDSSKTPPPGFRYHANGDSKIDHGRQEDIIITRGSDPEVEDDVLPDDTKTATTTTTDENTPVEYHVANINNGKTTKTRQKKVNNHASEIETLDQLKALILSNMDSQVLDRGAPQRSCILRSLSNNDQLHLAYLNRPSANYAYDPEENYKRERTNGRKSINLSRASKCCACQVKFNQRGSDMMKPLVSNYIFRKRWKFAPVGRFVSAPCVSTQISFYTKRDTPSSAVELIDLTNECSHSSGTPETSSDPYQVFINAKGTESSNCLLPLVDSKILIPSRPTVNSSIGSELRPTSRSQMLKLKAIHEADICDEKVKRFLLRCKILSKKDTMLPK